MKLRIVKAYLEKTSTYVEAPYGILESGQAPGLHGLEDVLDQRSSQGTSSSGDFTKLQNKLIESKSEDGELDKIYQQFLEKIRGR